MAKVSQKDINKICKMHRVEDPQKSIILEVVKPEKIMDFIEFFTHAQRDIFNALYPAEELKKEEIRQRFLKAFNDHDLWTRYSKYDSLEAFSTKGKKKPKES